MMRLCSASTKAAKRPDKTHGTMKPTDFRLKIDYEVARQRPELAT